MSKEEDKKAKAIYDYRHPHKCGKNDIIPVPESTNIMLMIKNKEIKKDALVKISEDNETISLVYEFKKIK